MRKFALITILVASALFANSEFAPGPEEDEMGQLPNCTLDTASYSGYLNVSEGKSLHYVFIGSQDKDTDPVVIWFNGGPGCSSLEGLF